MPRPDFDPRGKVDRALLAGVYEYDHAEDLPGVRHNLGEMFDALISGGLFSTSEIEPVSPQGASEFLTALDRVAKEARGLLLVYFAGHGRLSAPRDRDPELFLAFGRSRRLPGDEMHYSESVSWNQVLRTLRSVAESGTVDQIGCRLAGIGLKAPKADDAVAGFRESAQWSDRGRPGPSSRSATSARSPTSGYPPRP